MFYFMKERKYKYFMHFLAKNNKEKSTASTRRSSRTKSVAKGNIDDNSDDNDSTSATISAKHGI